MSGTETVRALRNETPFLWSAVRRNRPAVRAEVRSLASKVKQGVIRDAAWLLPDSVTYWAAIRVGARATSGQYATSPCDLLFMDAIQRWQV